MYPKNRGLKPPQAPGAALAGLRPPTGKPVRVETENYRLRSLTPADASPKLQQWLGDDTALRGINLPKIDWTLERLRSFLAAYDNRNRYAIGIYTKTGDEPIGFYTLDVNLQHKRGMLTAVLIDRAHWGTNVIHEATIQLARHMFQTRGIDKVSVGVLATNWRMIYHLMRAPLFPFEGRLRREVLTPEGKRVDLLVFAAHADQCGDAQG